MASRPCDVRSISCSVAVCLVLVALLMGCGGGEPEALGGGVEHVALGTEQECVDAWNAHPHDANRARVLAGGSWNVEVSKGMVNHPAGGNTGAVCSYVFFTDERWLSFSGAWKTDGSFGWQDGLTQAGQRTPEQRFDPTRFMVQPDGSLG